MRYQRCPVCPSDLRSLGLRALISSSDWKRCAGYSPSTVSRNGGNRGDAGDGRRPGRKRLYAELSHRHGPHALNRRGGIRRAGQLLLHPGSWINASRLTPDRRPFHGGVGKRRGRNRSWAHLAYFGRGGEIPSSARCSLPSRNAPTAFATARATLATSSCKTQSESSVSCEVA